MLIQIRKIIKLLRLAIASPRALDPQNHYGELEPLFTVTTRAFYQWPCLSEAPCNLGSSARCLLWLLVAHWFGNTPRPGVCAYLQNLM